jgi:NADPH:quinone reductase-like Zn-dependent oxidoreductase
MRAIVYDRYGPPEILRLAEVPRPSPKANEILIRIVAATVNRTDCGFRRGEPWIARFWSGLTRPRLPILGNELSGEIEEVGADVKTFQVGDQVCGLTGARFGAHAEYVCLPADAPIIPRPSDLGTDFTRLDRIFDVVLDAVGKSTFGACRRLLKPDGRYLSTDLGPWWQNPLLQAWTGSVVIQVAGR